MVADLVAEGRLAGRLLDVGCGSGEHTILAAQAGSIALGIDVSRVAIKRAVDRAAARGVAARFAVASAFALEELGERFDVILDSGVFHVFDAAGRARYEAGLASVVREGGAAPWLSAQLAQASDGELVVVWQSQLREHLTAAESNRLATVLRAAAAGATGPRPVAHVTLEPDRGEPRRPGLRLSIRTWPDGEKRELGSCDYGPPVAWANVGS